MDIDRRLDGLVPVLAQTFAKRRKPTPSMDGSHNPTPTERIEAERFIEMVKFTLTDEWLKFCHPDEGYHASPHVGCILR